MSKAFIILQYLLPHHLLSALMHSITRIEWPPFKNYLIRRIVDIYQVDLSQAKQKNIENFRSFNDFFTRELAEGAREICSGDNTIAAPVDGEVSQAGNIVNGRIFQAKKHDYSLYELLGGNAELADRFSDGKFATIYLSPRDYHRIHMPVDGLLQSMTHVPGRLFSVSQLTTREVPRLFARNERLINIFQAQTGHVAVIMVGAIFVSSMDTVWAGTITPERAQPHLWQYQTPEQIRLAKGEEMGRFNMGSTVILLFTRDSIEWSDKLKPGASVSLGENIATINEKKAIPSPQETPEHP